MKFVIEYTILQDFMLFYDKFSEVIQSTFQYYFY